MEVPTNKKLSKVLRVILVESKHDSYLLDASTENEWARSALWLLTHNAEEGCYYEPEPLSDDEERMLRITDEEIAALPSEILREQAAQERKTSQKMEKEHKEEKRWWDEMKKVVEEQSLRIDTYGAGTRHERREPRAWTLLRERSDYEYERVSLENIEGVVAPS